MNLDEFADTIVSKVDVHRIVREAIICRKLCNCHANELSRLFLHGFDAPSDPYKGEKLLAQSTKYLS